MTTAPSISTGAARRGRAGSAEVVVREAGLPTAIAGLVLDVAKRTRLWKRERADVAMELCAHFRGGLADGVGEVDLIRDFGDPGKAAALIRPARKRLRPLWWRAARGSVLVTGGVLGLCVLLYAVAAARFFMGSPTIRHNYMKEMNAVTLATPVEQRGWPKYIEALREFAPIPEAIRVMDVPRRSSDAGWAEYSAWIRSHPEGLQSIREAAARPTLGYVLGSDIDPELIKIMEINAPTYKHMPGPEVENPLAVGILLPQLGEMRKMARWLGVDAEGAAIERDRGRFIADVEAMLGMADQCRAGPFFITQLVGVAIFDYACQTVQMHATEAGFLGDDDLVRLSHLLVAGPRASARLDITSEAVIVDDVLQRFYTDDGRGGGRFIRSPDLTKIYEDFGVAKPRGAAVLAAYRPIQSAIMPSRAEFNTIKEHFLARASADEALPPWRHDERRSDEIYERLSRSGFHQILPIIASLQGGQRSRPIVSGIAARDVSLARRDALLIVIALELHHRLHGSYPTTLTELTPSLLPAVPLDPMSGQPFRYKSAAETGGTPLLYSVGADGVDDGGRAPATKLGRQTAAQLDSVRDYRQPSEDLSTEMREKLENGKGDWVIWPEPALVEKS